MRGMEKRERYEYALNQAGDGGALLIIHYYLQRMNFNGEK